MRGLPNSYGLPLVKDYIPSTNADVAEAVLNDGAIIFGKTNLPLMGMDTQTFNEVYGQTSNPWDITLTPGGSSGGAAAALAAGLTALEIGNDNGGSIRTPAHFCGVYGHKSSYGIISTQGGSEPWSIMDPNYVDSYYNPPLDLLVCGPLGRSAEDLKLAMDVIVGPPMHQRKAITIKLPQPRKTNLKEFKVGVWIDDHTYPTDSAVGDCLQNFADRLAKAGCTLKTEKPVIDLGQSYRLWNDLVVMSLSHTQPLGAFDTAKNALGTLKDNDQSLQAIWTRAMTAYHRDWNKLNFVRAIMSQKWADYFQKFDVLLCPVVKLRSLLTTTLKY